MSSPIYNIDFRIVSEKLSPPYKRTVKLLSWLAVILYPLQWLRDLVLGYYAEGVIANSIPFYNNSTTYHYGDMVIGTDDKVYQNIYSGTTVGIHFSKTSNWIKVLDTYMGLRDRLIYNSQTMVLEAILNKKFRVPADNDPIFIDDGNDDIDQVYFYKSNEGYLGVYFKNITEPGTVPVYLYHEQEYIPQFDYTVMVPIDFPTYYPAAPEWPIILMPGADPPPPPDHLKLVESETSKYNLIDKRFNVKYYPEPDEE